MKSQQKEFVTYLFISLFIFTGLIRMSLAEESPLFLDVRVKEINYDSPKKGVFHDGPVGKVSFDSVQMSSGDIDIIDLKKENISIIDSKIFFKKNPKREKYSFFGQRPRTKETGGEKLGLSISNKMARFQMLLEKNTALEDLRKVSSRDVSLKLNPLCPQVQAPSLELKMDNLDLTAFNLDITCPSEKKRSPKMSDDILLKCLNGVMLKPLDYSVPKKASGYPQVLCNDYLKNKPYMERERGSLSKTADFSIHMRPKKGEKIPKEIRLKAKMNYFNLHEQGIEIGIEKIFLDFTEFDSKNPNSVKSNMQVEVPSAQIVCEKKPIRNKKFEAKDLVDDCLNGLRVPKLGSISVKDKIKGTSFKIIPKKIDVNKSLTFFATEICIADSKKAIILKDLRTKCSKNKNEVFTELPKTIQSCLKNGHIVINNINSVESKDKPNCDDISKIENSGSIKSKNDLQNILSKAKFYNPFSSKKGIEKIRNEKKYLRGISIVINNNKLSLDGTLLLSKIETSIGIEGELKFVEKEKTFNLKLTKARLPFGIESTKLTAWLIKSFLANDKVWVGKNKTIFIKL